MKLFLMRVGAWLCVLLCAFAPFGGGVALGGALEALPEVDGQVVMDDSWIVVVVDHDAYHRFGDIVPVKGFVPDLSGGDPSFRVFAAESTKRSIPGYNVSIATDGPAENAESFREMMDLVHEGMDTEISPVKSVSLLGQTAYYFWMSHEGGVAYGEGDEAELSTPYQYFFLWVPAIGDTSLGFSVDPYPPEGVRLPSETELLVFATAALQSVTLMPETAAAPLEQADVEDGWLLYRYEKDVHYKIGEVAPAPGYVPDAEDASATSLVLRSFTSADANGRGIHYYVTGLGRDAVTAATTAQSNFALFYPDDETSPVQTTGLIGREACYFSVKSNAEQQLVAYIPAAGDTCVLLDIAVPFSAENPPLDEAALLALAGELAATITLVE